MTLKFLHQNPIWQVFVPYFNWITKGGLSLQMIDFYMIKCTRVINGGTFIGDIRLGVFGMTLRDRQFHLMGIDTPK